jgi:hypothetical protein
MDQIPSTRPVAPIADQQSEARRFARRVGRRRADLAGAEVTDDDLEPTDLPSAVPGGTDPAQALLDALDRLRVTQDARPADQEYAAVVRKLRAYQDSTTAYHIRPHSASEKS